MNKGENYMELKEAMLKVCLAAMKNDPSKELVEAIVVLGIAVDDAVEYYQLQAKADEWAEELKGKMLDDDENFNGGQDA